MEFGYFTLSDNHYDNNPRSRTSSSPTSPTRRSMPTSSACTRPGSASIISTRSACCPAPIWCSPISRRAPRHIRLAPAVTVLPLHHPIRVAEQWATLDLLRGGRVDFAAGRGYDRREYLPFHVSFADNQAIFEEGMELVRRLWAAEGRISHHGKHYSFDDVRITPQAGAAADPGLCRVVLQALDRACRAARLRPDRRAVRRGDELRRAQAGRRPLSRDLRQARQQARAG